MDMTNTALESQGRDLPSAVLRYTAFDVDGKGGNPAGVVLDARGMDDARMQEIAAEVGYSETAFLTRRGARDFAVRYFSPLAEVAFCGHATIATAVALAEREGPGALRLPHLGGEVAVATRDEDGRVVATLTSVPPDVASRGRRRPRRGADRAPLGHRELDPALPPRIAYAGDDHLVLAAGDPPGSPTSTTTSTRLGDLMARRELDDRAARLAGERRRLPRPRPVPARRSR